MAFLEYQNLKERGTKNTTISFKICKKNVDRKHLLKNITFIA